MVCIFCASDTQVANSRPQKRLNQVWRRRRCLGCGAVMTSIEAIDLSRSVLVRKADGSLQPFNRDQLFLSLHAACAHRPTAIDDAAGLAETISSQALKTIQNGSVNADDIRDIALEALEHFDGTAAAVYRAYHKS